MSDQTNNRELTAEERQLCRWMLENGSEEGRTFLPQLERAQVAPWICPCGCASLDFSIDNQPKPTGGLHLLGDFLFGTEVDLSGIFVFEQEGILSGIEVYGLSGEAPRVLPSFEVLRPFSNTPPQPPTGWS